MTNRNRGQAPAPESVPPLMPMPPTAAESREAAGVRVDEEGHRWRTIVPPAPEVYLVVMDGGGIFGAWLDAGRALEAAQAIKGVVCTVPVTADFR